MHGNKDWDGSKVHLNTELWTELTARQWNSSGISSQDSAVDLRKCRRSWNCVLVEALLGRRSGGTQLDCVLVWSVAETVQ